MQRKQVTDLAGLVKELESRAKRLALERDDLAGALKREANAHVEDVEHGKRMLTDKEAVSQARILSDLLVCSTSRLPGHRSPALRSG